MPYKDPVVKRAYDRRYRADHPEAQAEADRRFRENHPDRIAIKVTRQYAERRLRSHGLL